MLKSIEINGFKSFGKKAVLEFTSPISAIVGPNGSGKSNVAEGFRFVLGEQSIKSMRGKRGEDLIFNGSEGGPQSMGRFNRASVKLVFDNRKKLLPLDFDEVSIERIVHRDSVNEYLINGSQVRLKDVQELLSHAHIGSSGHHIISQGEADRILSANLRERRSMIEDALGLKIYQYKKLESERKLLKTEENMKQVESLRRELAPHLKFLKKQVEKIEKAQALKQELFGMYKDYLKREDLYLRVSKKHVEKGLEKPEKERKELTSKLESIREKLRMSVDENEHKLILIEAEEAHRKAGEEKQKLSHAIGRIEGEINSLVRIREKSKQVKEEEGNATVYVRDVEKLIAEVTNEFNSAEESGSFEIVKNTFVKIKELFNSFVSSHKTKSHRSGENEFEEDLNRLSKEKEELEEKLAKKQKEEHELGEKIKKLNQKIESEKQGSREAEREMFQIMAKQTELQSTISMLLSRQNQLQLEEDDFKREINEAYVLVGRNVSEYERDTIRDKDGNALSEEVIVGEIRSFQHERRKHLEKLKIRLEEFGGGSSDEVMKEYNETEERDLFLAKELEDLEKSGNDLRNLIKELDEKLNSEFRNGIEKINHEFQKYFELLFGGGKASLKVIREEKRKKSDTDIEIDTDEETPGEEEENGPEGIDISVDLPKKKVKALMMLSGGERALTSIALLFAMSQVNPPPFIILDETDAALDEANSRKYGDMIENLAHYSQLIVITHNRETMSRAGVLYGVTMTSGLSKLLSIKFDEAVAVAK